jgi:hypothetical protein
MISLVRDETDRFRVKGLQPIENVHDTARDPEYLAYPNGWDWIIITKSKFPFDKWCLRFFNPER